MLSLTSGNLLIPLHYCGADWLLAIHCLQGHQGHSACLTQATPTLAYVPSTGRVSTSPLLYSLRYALRAAVQLAVALNAVNLATPLPQISSFRLAPFDLSSDPVLTLSLSPPTPAPHKQTILCYVRETLRSFTQEFVCLWLLKCMFSFPFVVKCSSYYIYSKHRTRFSMETLCRAIKVLHDVVFMRLEYSYKSRLGIDPIVPLVNHQFLYL